MRQRHWTLRLAAAVWALAFVAGCARPAPPTAPAVTVARLEPLQDSCRCISCSDAYGGCQPRFAPNGQTYFTVEGCYHLLLHSRSGGPVRAMPVGTELMTLGAIWCMGSAVWTPDGAGIVVSEGMLRGSPTADFFGPAIVYLVDLATVAGRQVGQTYSPRRLVFDARGRLVVATQTGYQALDLTSGETVELPGIAPGDATGVQTELAFSPDGRHVAALEGEQLAIVDLNSGQKTPIASRIHPQWRAAFAWSGDGRQLAYATGGSAEAPELWVVGAGGAAARRLLVREGGQGGAYAGLAWLPGTSTIVYQFVPAGVGPALQAEYQAVSAAGGLAKTLFKNGLGLTLSPDGHVISFVRDVEGEEGTGHWIAVLEYAQGAAPAAAAVPACSDQEACEAVLRRTAAITLAEDSPTPSLAPLHISDPRLVAELVSLLLEAQPVASIESLPTTHLLTLYEAGGEERAAAAVTATPPWWRALGQLRPGELATIRYDLASNRFCYYGEPVPEAWRGFFTAPPALKELLSAQVSLMAPTEPAVTVARLEPLECPCCSPESSNGVAYPVCPAKLAPDGETYLTTAERTALVLHPRSGGPAREVRLPEPAPQGGWYLANAVWTPDGAAIVASQAKPDSPAMVYLVDPATGDGRLLGETYSPWRLVFDTRGRLVVATQTGYRALDLTSGEAVALPGIAPRDAAGIQTELAFSPDGRHVAALEGEQLAIVDLNSRQKTPIAGRIHRHWRAAFAWSGDGQTLAYATGDYYESPELWVVDAGGAGARRLLVREGGRGDAYTGLAWLPGTPYIIYQLVPTIDWLGVPTEYQVLSAEGGPPKTLFENGLGLTLSPDGHTISLVRDDEGWMAVLEYAEDVAPAGPRAEVRATVEP